MLFWACGFVFNTVSIPRGGDRTLPEMASSPEASRPGSLGVTVGSVAYFPSSVAEDIAYPVLPFETLSL